MEPYKLLLELKENKILFSYMDTVAVYVEDDKWTIIGDSDSGELRINITESNVLRVALPIPLPVKLPLPVLEEVLIKMETEFDGLLKVEIDPQFGNFILYYYIHIGLNDYERDLSKSLIRFAQDRRSISKVFSDLIRSINTFKSNMFNGLKKSGAKDFKGPELWKDMQALDKKFSEDSEEGTKEEDLWDEDNNDSDKN